MTPEVAAELKAQRAGSRYQRRALPSTPASGDWFTEDDRLDDGTWRCAFCGGPLLDGGVNDHCHDTGLLRGLLCHSCNSHEGRHNTPALEWWRLTAPELVVGRRHLWTLEGVQAGISRDRLMTEDMAHLIESAQAARAAYLAALDVSAEGVITRALFAGGAA